MDINDLGALNGEMINLLDPVQLIFIYFIHKISRFNKTFLVTNTSSLVSTYSILKGITQYIL